MKALVDTSVLIAAFYEDHEHHGPSLGLLLRHPPAAICCSTHSIAEVYATLTAMPGSRRVSPPEAILYLEEFCRKHPLIGLDGGDYLRAAELAASCGAISGGIFDALIGQSFLKSEAEWLFTWNLKHFQRFGSNIGARVRTPDTTC